MPLYGIRQSASREIQFHFKLFSLKLLYNFLVNFSIIVMIAVAVCYFIRERKFDYESLGKSFFVCFGEGSDITLGIMERYHNFFKDKNLWNFW